MAICDDETQRTAGRLQPAAAAWPLAALLASVVFAEGVAAADLPRMRERSPAAHADWTGAYLGGQFGYGTGGFGPGTQPLPLQGVVFPSSITGLTGGGQIGHNRHLTDRLVVGAEADIWFGSPLDLPRRAVAPFNTSFDYVATARGRLGYSYGPWLPYVTAGLAIGGTHVHPNDASGNPVSQLSRHHAGWTAGAGVEWLVGGAWSAKADYSYVSLGARAYDLGGFGLPAIEVRPDIHTVRFGLNYHLWDAPGAIAAMPLSPVVTKPSDWSVHGQTTMIMSGYPRFRSPYQGAYSLPGGGQGRETVTASAFIGWRAWEGGEFHFNPELAQGFGLNSTLGLAGFPNGEAQKGGDAYPRFRAQRYFFRQTFGLGGEQEEVAEAFGQFPGKRDIDRVTVTVGRFAVGDVFDGNAYAKDPRADFMNWAMWASAAYDFPADLPGMTRGAIVDLNRRDFAIRAGLFQVPSAPNSDVLTFRTGGAVLEFEQRYALLEQPGKLRLGVFANRGNTANYRNAVANAAIDPGLEINEIVPGLRRQNLKYGYYLNVEQQIVNDVGMFARWSWNDGRNEILSFTDIDRSLSAGLSVKGSHWGRPADTFGLGGAVNGLSGAHRDFLAAGGLGLLIGDGRLNYRTERILETYYAYAVNRRLTVTADYQLIANPAYNKDRGPVSIFSGRLHGEF